MHTDHLVYYDFTKLSRLDKSINSLIGIVEGVTVDSMINTIEIEFMNQWISENQELKGRHPYNELFPVVEDAIADGVLTSEEKQDSRFND